MTSINCARIVNFMWCAQGMSCTSRTPSSPILFLLKVYGEEKTRWPSKVWSWPRKGGDVRNRGSSQRTMSTYMDLSSENQPDVAQLICSRWADPQTRYHVSVEQIVRSLGSIAQFVPPR